MYQILNLSLKEDNEHTMSQAFSCHSVVLSVYVCLCAHASVRMGKSSDMFLFFS